jgi:uncharacterized membrane protein YcaP (DUF421 family)
MDSVLRAAAVYVLLLFVFRIAGKRALAQITTFDFVLLLVIGEAMQPALVGEDHSFTHAALLILTLVGMDVLFSFWKLRSARADRVLDGLPLVVMEEGKLRHELARAVRVDECDILMQARQQGLERLDQIKYAVIERNGKISIVPKP